MRTIAAQPPWPQDQSTQGESCRHSPLKERCLAFRGFRHAGHMLLRPCNSGGHVHSAIVKDYQLQSKHIYVSVYTHTDIEIYKICYQTTGFLFKIIKV